MRGQIRSALVLLAIMTVLLGIAYPLAITGLAQVFFPGQANGSLITGSDGKVIGSALIGQNFTGPGYFHPRPSAAGASGYDATASGGSNLGPTNKKLIDIVNQRAIAYRQENGLAAGQLVPVDAVTASASGLDPDITPANAYLQAPRVAKARGMAEADVRSLVQKHTEGPVLGIFGESTVNVLELNLDLDRLSGRSGGGGG
ncbi:MAG: K(+)-transporting ATPase subunit C [Chloroflexi bacterium]|nr:K(+)-transporting ATPase subunit C [Chloroflexota bacterium]